MLNACSRGVYKCKPFSSARGRTRRIKDLEEFGLQTFRDLAALSGTNGNAVDRTYGGDLSCSAGKKELAVLAKQQNLDAIHDTVHEMAKDEARHGCGFAGLLNRYFSK